MQVFYDDPQFEERRERGWHGDTLELVSGFDLGQLPAPIGWHPAQPIPFRGTFLGRGQQIRSFSIDRSGGSHVGLFSVIGDGGVVNSLVIGHSGGSMSVVQSNASNIGVLAGELRAGGSITNITLVNVRVEGSGQGANVGGVVGLVSGGILRDARTTQGFRVDATGNDANVGGFVGHLSGGMFEDAMLSGFASVQINASGDNSSVGGAVGRLSSGAASNIKIPTANITVVLHSSATGGIVGRMTGGALSNVDATPQSGVSMSASNQGILGGVIGHFEAGVANDVTFDGDIVNAWVAVIEGMIAGTIEDAATINLWSAAQHSLSSPPFGVINGNPTIIPPSPFSAPVVAFSLPSIVAAVIDDEGDEEDKEKEEIEDDEEEQPVEDHPAKEDDDDDDDDDGESAKEDDGDGEPAKEDELDDDERAEPDYDDDFGDDDNEVDENYGDEGEDTNDDDEPELDYKMLSFIEDDFDL